MCVSSFTTLNLMDSPAVVDQSLDASLFCQVNLEYLGRVVFNSNGLLYPDSVVGTDSHTTMINGLGVVGWGK